MPISLGYSRGVSPTGLVLQQLKCNGVAQEEFKDMIEAAGFKAVDYENINGGVVAIHSAWKL